MLFHTQYFPFLPTIDLRIYVVLRLKICAKRHMKSFLSVDKIYRVKDAELAFERNAGRWNMRLVFCALLLNDSIGCVESGCTAL